jgi:rhamnosyltransferase
MQGSATELATPRTIAGVVTFHPQRTTLLASVARIAPDVSAVIVYANSPIEPDLERALRSEAGVTPLQIVSPGDNLGLGVAYNEFARIAAQLDADYVLLLDQDSTPAPGMVPKLEGLFGDLRATGERPAAVGPQPVTAEGQPFKVPRTGQANSALAATPAEFIISSGSLISTEALREVGGFREDFFIDAIDLEWCFRARHRRWSIWIANDVTMTHELGRGVISIPFGLRLTDQPPGRLYTYLRNQLAMLRLRHVPGRRKALMLGYLPFQCLVYSVRSRFSRPILKAIVAGFGHGLTNKLGSPHKAWAWINGAKR